MSLAFWRRPAAPEFDYYAWSSGRLAAAVAFQQEMRNWGEPIDTIRAGLGLPERWQRSSQRAWQKVLELAGSLYVRPAPYPGEWYVGLSTTTWPSGYLWDLRGHPAGAGNPVHDEALRRARGF